MTIDNTRAGVRGERDERENPRGRRPPVGTDGNPPETPTHTHRRGEGAHDDGTRADERDEEREEGGGWPEPGEATRREPPGRRQTDALPRDTPRLLATPRIRADGRGRGLEGGRGAAAGPPVHTRGSEAQRRGGRGDP